MFMLPELLSNFPTEVFTGLVSSFLGWKTANARLAVEVQQAKSEISTKAANSASSRGGPWVRRILALMAASYLFLWPVVFALIGAFTDREVPVVYMTTAEGGWWIWSSTKLVLTSIHGFVFTPVQTHLATSVFFYYFGAGVAGKVRSY